MAVITNKDANECITAISPFCKMNPPPLSLKIPWNGKPLYDSNNGNFIFVVTENEWSDTGGNGAIYKYDLDQQIRS